MTDHRPQDTRQISFARAVGLMVPVYLLIPLPSVWWARQFCLLDREDCGYEGIVATIASNWQLQAVCLLIAGLLLFITAHMVVRARNGTLGVEDADERRFKANGYLIVIVVYVLYVGGALAVLTDAAKTLEPFDIDAADSYFRKSSLALLGTFIAATVLWHLNEYLVWPASKLIQAVLFIASLGCIYWAAKLPI